MNFVIQEIQPPYGRIIVAAVRQSDILSSLTQFCGQRNVVPFIAICSSEFSSCCFTFSMGTYLIYRPFFTFIRLGMILASASYDCNGLVSFNNLEFSTHALKSMLSVGKRGALSLPLRISLGHLKVVQVKFCPDFLICKRTSYTK